MLSLFLLTYILVTSAFSSSSQDCFSPPGQHHPVMELVEGVLEKRLDDWLGRIFGEEFPFFGTESETCNCSQGECGRKGMKLLGNFSGPFQIEVMSFLKWYPCEIILTQMSSLPSNLGWTKLFQEKAGFRGEEGELLMEGLARKVFEAKYFEKSQPGRGLLRVWLLPPLSSGRDSANHSKSQSQPGWSGVQAFFCPSMQF